MRGASQTQLRRTSPSGQGDSRYAGTWPLEHYDIADTTDRLKLAEREAELERAKKRLELQKRVAKYEDAQRAAEEARRELKALDAKGTSQDAVVEPAKSTSSSWATVPGHPGIQARTQADGTIRYRARHAGKVSKTLATLEEAQSEYTAMGGEAPTQRSSVLSPFDVERMGL